MNFMGKKVDPSKFQNSMLDLQREQVSFIILKNQNGYEIDFIPTNINPSNLFLCSCNENKFLWFSVVDYLLKCKNCEKIYKYNTSEVKLLSKPLLKKILINKLKGSVGGKNRKN